MQVTETVSDGLKREFQVVVPAADLEARVNERLDELKDQVRINGFRPGKVPVDASQARLRPRGDGGDDRGRRSARPTPRSSPTTASSSRWSRKVTHPERGGRGREGDRRQVRSRLHGGARDPAADRARRLQGHQARAAGRRGRPRRRSTRRSSEIAEQNRPFAAKGEGAKAENGDRVGHRLHRQDRRQAVRGRHRRRRRRAMSAPAPSSRASRISSIGMAAGETRHGQGDLPGRPIRPQQLAGKEAEFDVTAKSVEAPQPA